MYCSAPAELRCSRAALRAELAVSQGYSSTGNTSQNCSRSGNTQQGWWSTRMSKRLQLHLKHVSELQKHQKHVLALQTRHRRLRPALHRKHICHRVAAPPVKEKGGDSVGWPLFLPPTKCTCTCKVRNGVDKIRRHTGDSADRSAEAELARQQVSQPLGTLQHLRPVHRHVLAWFFLSIRC